MILLLNMSQVNKLLTYRYLSTQVTRGLEEKRLVALTPERGSERKRERERYLGADTDVWRWRKVVCQVAAYFWWC